MTPSPAWFGVWIRRRSGWERRTRIRRAVAVLALMALSCTGSPPWPEGALWRVHGITQTGAHEWTLEVSYWPRWEHVAVLVSSRETALRLDQALWVAGRD